MLISPFHYIFKSLRTPATNLFAETAYLNLLLLNQFTNGTFSDLAYNEASAATVQTLILVLNGSLGKLLPPLLDLLYSNCFSQEEGTENTLPYVFQDNCAQRTLEVALSVGSSTFYDKAYERLFKGRLVDLCETEAKFAVISLIGGCKDKEKFSEIYEELEPNFKRFLTEGEGGIMLAIAKASQKLVTKQGNFLSKLLEFSSCTDPEGNNPCLIQSVLRIQASKFSKGSNKITDAGSQMVQTLLRFNKPIKMINSMLSLPANELRDLFCDPCGSYVMDTFVSSPSIGEKSRDRLRNKLKGEFAGLASSEMVLEPSIHCGQYQTSKQKLLLVKNYWLRRQLLLETNGGQLFLQNMD
ncbi:nucleolar protein 9-like [Artemia franciscana]|uniref:nucleolar protein 9-like n=1 Tax=Artemia franciscana TaxID=6661 RepID=UPI0032DA38C5